MIRKTFWTVKTMNNVFKFDFRVQKTKFFLRPILQTDHNFSRYVRYLCSGSGVGAGTIDTPKVPSDFPKQSRVVICGGGVVGTSLAYHLTELGWNDVVILEQGSISCGTTWHSVGLIGQLKTTPLLSKLSQYSRNLFHRLENEGHALGWKQCGSLNVARTKDRMISFKRQMAFAKPLGIECHLVDQKEIKELCPLLREDDLEGGIWVPEDGVVNPTDLTNTYASLARSKGAKLFERCKVLKVHTSNKTVTGVDTSFGHIDCDYFVNCAGQWARDVGQLSNPKVLVPLHSCEHFYIVTKPVDVPNMMPLIRDYDGHVYIREWSGGFMAGGFDPVAKPAFFNGIPDNFEFQQLPDDWDHFQILLEQLLTRVPSMKSAEVRSMMNGPESFTPDGKFIMGQSPEIQNYFVSAGMNSSGIQFSGAVGNWLSSLIVLGVSPEVTTEIDVKRFGPFHNNSRFLFDRVKETVGHLSSIPYPQVEFSRGRKLRMSPLHLQLEASGACFVEQMAFERTAWFSRKAEQEDFVDSKNMYSSHDATFGKPSFFDDVKQEYWGCRNAVCLIDMSSFAKFDITSSGSEVVEFLQYMCSNDVDKPVGSVLHTGMQNHKGGFENDCSLVRLADNHFMMVGPTNQQTRSFAWMSQHLPEDGSVQLSDVTSKYTAINVIGPRAKELLGELTDISMKMQDFPSMTCKKVNLGYASDIIAMRLTHTGEDGCILYIPNEYALHIYDTLMKAGKDYGIRNAGYYALRSLRIERFFAYWGQDLDAHTTPLECNREFRVKFEMDCDFIGKEALLKQRKAGIKQKFIQLFIQGHDLDCDPWPWGGEPIYMNGVYAGMTTSAAYGYTLEKLICLGFVQVFDDNGLPQFITNDSIMKGSQFEVDIAGKRYQARAGILPPKIPPATTDIYIPSVY